MRDYALLAIVAVLALSALRYPWIGVMLWTWVSIMNPHRYTYGFAYDFPVALLAAVSTLIGLLLTTQRDSPFGKGSPPIWLMLFMVWMTLSWVLGMSPADDYPQWDKVMKILVMVIVAVMVVRSQEQIFAFMWVCAGSMALIGIKGGLFTILTGGSDRVYGPPGSFIQENNSLALALVMTIPLLRFLQLQLRNRWGQRAMLAAMVLLAASALGSHSRGGLLAMGAMAALMWWRSPNRGSMGAVLVVAGIALVTFMPDNWSNRMSTIETYDADASAMGRIAAWWTAWNLAFDHIFGVGFNAARPELFIRYSPYGLQFGTPAAHSVYFQILGHHGFIGLFFWLGIWVSAWRLATRIRTLAATVPEARWCVDLANMAQVSMFGYFVGGAFLSLAYFDLPYNVMICLVMVYAWLQRKAWLVERPAVRGRFLRIPGISYLQKRKRA